MQLIQKFKILLFSLKLNLDYNGKVILLCHCLENLRYLHQLFVLRQRRLEECLWNNDNAKRNIKWIQCTVSKFW